MSLYGNLSSKSVREFGEPKSSTIDRISLCMFVHDAACRFERMIIALSTHALFANTTELLKANASDASAALVRSLRTSSFGVLTYSRVSCLTFLRSMFPWKRQSAVLAGHGNNMPLYFSSTGRIRNMWGLVSVSVGIT